MAITHAFVSAKPDSADSSIVSSSEWNAAHVWDNPENEIPTGTIDSIDGSDGNGDFTLSAAPVSINAVILVKNGLIQLAGVDFTLVGSTISYTFGRKPRVGDWHRIWFRK